jgi:hypothetical protein
LGSTSVLIALELLAQRRHRLVGPFDLVLLEQLGGAVEEEFGRLQVVLDFDRRGREEALLQAFARLRLGQLHERLLIALEARVLAQARQRRRATLGRDLLVEQTARAAEDQPRQVVVGHLQPLAQL